MIIKNGKTISSIYKGSQVIDKIIKGTLVVYEAFKNLLASGIPPLTLLKSKGDNLEDYKIYGNSIQQTYTGKNLFNKDDFVDSSYAKKQTDENGNEVIWFGDVNGITTNFLSPNIEFKENTIYTLSLKMKALNGVRVPSITFYYTDGTYQTISNAPNNTEYNFYSMTSQSGKSLLSIGSGNAWGVYGYILMDTIQIEKGSSASSYEPYVGEIVSPNPNYPQDVESVGEKTLNLFDVNYFNKNENYKDVWGSGYYTAEVKLKPNTVYTLEPKLIPNVEKPNETFYYKAGNSSIAAGGCSNVGSYVSTSGNYYHSKIKIQTLEDGLIYFHCSGNARQGLLDLIFSHYYFQLVEGETVPDYEPYGYRIPVKSSGKNVLNYKNGTLKNCEIEYIDNGFILTSTSSAGYYDVPVDLIKGNAYSVSFNSTRTGTTGGGYYSMTSDNIASTGSSSELNAENYWHIPPSATNKNIVCLRFFANNGGSAGDSATFTNVQLEEGNAKTNYEPYQEPITTNIYLNEPLRKINEHSDYIDFDNNKVVRKIKKAELTQATTTYTWAGLNGVYFSDILDGYYNRNTNCLSNRNSIFVATSSKPVSMWVGVTSSMIYWIGVLDVLGLTTKDEFNEWLANNPTYVLYATDYDPTEETIELPNIPTLKGTTLLSVDTEIQPSNMEVIYKGKP